MSIQPNDELNQHTWKLSKMGPLKAPQPISPDFNITLQFGKESRIYGKSACNRYVSTCHFDGSHLRFEAIASTRMMCSEPAMALENEYLAGLQQVESYRLKAESLTLYYAQGKSQLLFYSEVTAE